MIFVGCLRHLNTPKNGMLVMNNEETVAMAFCPYGSFLFKGNEPLVFPIKYVYDGNWTPETVDPGVEGGLVPIPDCVRKKHFSITLILNKTNHPPVPAGVEISVVPMSLKSRYF